MNTNTNRNRNTNMYQNIDTDINTRIIYKRRS